MKTYIKEKIAEKQFYKCANKNCDVFGLETYDCPLWSKVGNDQGCFDESGYEIINEHALCISCYTVKTKRLSNKKAESLRIVFDRPLYFKMKDKELLIDYDPEMNIMDVKVIINQKICIPVSKQIIKISGVKLSNDFSLRKIYAMDILHLSEHNDL